MTDAAPVTLTREEADRELTRPGGEFEIATADIFGVPTTVWATARGSLRQLFEESRQHFGKTFVVYEGERMSYEEHYGAVCRLAHTLKHDYGVQKGDRVAIAMRNYPEFPVAFFAVTAIGAIAVPLNAWWTGEEMEYGLRDSGSCVLIADQERLERVAPHTEGLDLRGMIAVRAEAAAIDGAVAFSDAIESAPEDCALPEAVIDPEDDATIFYTSGTTGFPKGALGTHRNISTNVTSTEFLARRGELRTGISPPEDVQPSSLLTVPLFHVTGCHSTMVPALARGAKLVLVYKFDAQRVCELLEQEQIGSFGGVPTLVWKVLESPNFHEHDYSSVVRVGYGGAPAAPELVRRLQEEFPQASPSNGYGLTETSALTTANAGADYVAKPGTVGPAVPVCTVKIVDDEGREVPRGEKGELWIAGANVIKGYWGKPEATAETFTEGWLHSGDVGAMDEEGFVYIHDRAKDMVIRGGENVYCVEVESALFDHESVIDAAVFGVPHRVLGEEVGAIVQVRQGAELGEGELLDFVRAKIASFKVPTHLEIQGDDFPRNANGKTMKRSMKSEFLERRGLTA